MATNVAPLFMTDAAPVVDAILDRVGKHIMVALPLGLGKAPHIINELYDRAVADPQITLSIFSALTLERPNFKSELEQRFFEPVFDRTMGGYPVFHHAVAQRTNSLPDNVEVNEFFVLAGTRLENESAQRSYLSLNYTHVAPYLLHKGVNLVLQLVARRKDQYSLSCNTDITVELLDARDQGKADFILAGQVNNDLPFMNGRAQLSERAFDVILDSPQTRFPLCGPPKNPISAKQHAIGMHVASLIPDGGTLQIGIGEVGEAVSNALVLRNERPEIFAATLTELTLSNAPRPPVELSAFQEGLYGSTEMLTDCFLQLVRQNIIKRKVDGALIHAGFFLGPRSFYATLREMSDEARNQIQMREISFVNGIYGDERAKREARKQGRFINNAMMMTLLGATISDGLDSGQVVSGVGGQYNFVAQAFALADARSIITLPSTRLSKAVLHSNILWSYAHTTIPRHLRDIVVTEYGVADLRYQTDENVIKRLLAITDSRFQKELLEEARKAGKIAKGWALPPEWQNNLPERIEKALPSHAFPNFPFGTDFTEVEQRLLPALDYLANANHSTDLAKIGAKGLSSETFNGEEEEALRRMGLIDAEGLRERTNRALVLGALRHVHAKLPENLIQS